MPDTLSYLLQVTCKMFLIRCLPVPNSGSHGMYICVHLPMWLPACFSDIWMHPLCVYMPLYLYKYIYIYMCATLALCISCVNFRRSKRSTFRRSKRSTLQANPRPVMIPSRFREWGCKLRRLCMQVSPYLWAARLTARKLDPDRACQGGIEHDASPECPMKQTVVQSNISLI